MTHSIDFTVIDNLRTSASRGQHAHVIQESFAIENELRQLQLHLLDMRARSYVACAHFVKALETATTMQQMNPSSALGYLCQGYVHMEQGRHIAACRVYDKALQHVDKNDPLYETITASKEKAIQQGQKRRDFIRDVPMEISSRIIHEMFFDEIYSQQREYVMVSWPWWQRIMATNHLEYSVDGTTALEETSDMVIRSFNHVRSLTYYYSNATLRQLLEKYPFASLTTLQLKGATPEEAMAALPLIGTRLTGLIYQKPPLLRNNGYTLRLQAILATCPNLVSFNCQSTIDISGLQETYPKLKTLEMYTVIGTVDNQVMMTLQQHLPGLKILDMAIVNSSRPLRIDDPWLPAIRHLGYGDRPTVYHQKLTFEEYEEQGLVTLSVAPTKDMFALDDVAPLVIHHHDTLQFLELRCFLDMTHTSKMTDAMQSYHDIEFTRLKMLLVYTLSDDTSMQFITWIIQRAPYLQEITLYGYTMNKYTLKALAKCVHLRCVFFIHDGSQRPEDYDTLVAEFVRDHVTYMADKSGSRLEYIKVRLHQAEPMLIEALRELKSLKTLDLATNDLASESFVRLLESLRQGCHQMEDLYMHNDRGVIPNRVLYQVSGFINLTRLSIRGNLGDTHAGVLSLQRCHRLQALTIHYPVDVEIVSMLREQLPGCHIMTPRIRH